MRYLFYISTFIILTTIGFCTEDVSGVTTEESNMQGHMMAEQIIRWLHIFAGIMWIGLLYFFNFVNGAFAATMSGDTKKAVVPELMPRALYWFRWGAAWTWFTGVALLGLVFYMSIGGTMPADLFGDEWEGPKYYSLIAMLIPFLAVFLYDFLYKSPLAKNTRLITIISFLLIAAIGCFMTCDNWADFGYRAYNIHIGAMFGTIMAFNVWFRIWPAQQKIITAIKEGKAPDGDLVALAGLRSKHNTYLSLPLIWTMINGHTALFNIDSLGNEGYGVLLIIIALGWHIIFQCYKKSGKVKGF